jgi:hypothetical protein
MTALDPETGEYVGPASAVQALLDGEQEVDDDALAATLAAARKPAFRVWTEGFEPAATVLGDGPLCVLVTERPEGEQALLPTTTEQLPVALVAWLGLGPRPVPDHPPVRLVPGAMAVLIGRGEAHGHDLPPEVAANLQARLDAGVRHWTVRVERAGWRRNLEVLEGEAGIWRVRPADQLVELAPTTTTAVVRELIALLVATAATTESESARGPMIADRPATPSD